MSESGGESPVLIKQSNQLLVLNEIARVATLDVELRDALQRITDILCKRFQWEFVACLSLEHEEEDHVVCEALSTDLDTPFRVGAAQRLSDDMLGRAVAERTPVLLDAASSGDPSIGVVQDVSAEFCIPITHGGDVVALLHLGSERWAAFRDQLPLLTAVASQVASAVASTKRLEALRRQASLTEMLSKVSRIAMEATELPDILKRIVHFIGTKFPVDVASILLLDQSGSKFIFEVYAGAIDLRMPDGDEWPIEVGACGRCVRTGEPQLVIDTESDSRLRAGKRQSAVGVRRPNSFWRSHPRGAQFRELG